ncbi:arf-GAP with dual PH domain-containing protein 1 isoform X2 [Physeter macrocephalus]|uniref:Arf-GAP with dual PH domain-containing protein 1 isoform X2 n=1 Tax=Physeter macrocephalus TaxID=9755 RepID=A0A455C2N6_PHYMC|nr:arf-GAP with dual PH domain-containing protein 1 isoform X2 [Physeter catodon]|eukprot:XP_028355684.1 arf-GAP with dual PH domain-containing protein 1 isoform X2 [Physeter catodon]
MAKERRKAVLELLQRPANARCADCGAPDPDWASYTLGVFICLSCSGIHRNIPQVSKVKSVRLDTWEDAQVEFMTSRGNHVARATFESKVPPFYYRPSASDCQLLREQWIRAKYERQEFTHPERQEPYSAGYREGFLWKRGRDNGQFLSRKFVLTEREGALKYFNRSDAKEPKAIMKIEHLNATFQPAKIGHPHGLQVTYLKDNSTRNIFVYHEDGKEMVDWFNALRAARFHYLQVAFPGASDADLVPKLSRNYLQEGYMEKTGPKQTEGFRKRWFTMDDRRLMYFKDPLVRMGRGPRAPAAWTRPLGSPARLGGADQHLLGELKMTGRAGKEGPGLGAARGSEQRSARSPSQDAFARGEVFIGSRESGYTVLDGLPPSTQGHHWPHGITIVTPERRFLLACETESEQRAWMEAFRKVVDRPMLPQEYAVEAHFKHKP